MNRDIKLDGEVDLEVEENDILRVGDPKLDEAFSLERGTSILIFGPPFTGKTTLALTISINEIKESRGRVFYIDTENGVSPYRVKAMLNSHGISLQESKFKLKLLRVFSLREALGYASYAIKNDFSLIVIDSLSRLFYIEAHKHNETEVSEVIYNALNELQKEAYERNSTIIITSESKDVEEQTLDLESLNPHQLLALHKYPWPLTSLGSLAKIAVGLIMLKGRRYAFIERHRSKPSVYEDLRYYEFCISNEGIKYVGSVEFIGSKVAYKVSISST